MFLRRSRRLLLLMLTLLLGLLVAACAPVTPVAQAPAADAPAASTAGDDGPLVIYTALEDDQLETYLAGFAAEHPEVEVEIVRDSTGIITAKFLAEAENPQADLIWGLAATSLLVADAQGLLEPYAPAGLDRVLPQFRDDAEVPAWVGIDTWESAFCVNTVELEAQGLPMPTSWADLLDPVYAGQIVMPNPASSGTGFLSVSGILQMMGEEEGWAYLDALHENIAQYTHSGSKPCRMAGAGEYVIGISFGYRGIRQAEAGEPVATVWPAEGSGWDLEANALVKKPEIKENAKLFLDWAISDAAMALYATNYPITSVPLDTAGPAGYLEDPLSQLIENDLDWAAANRDAILAEWTVRYDGKSEPQ